MRKYKVILDTNFLFIPIQFQIDIFEEITNLRNARLEPVLLSTTYEELLSLVDKGTPKIRKQAILALKMAKKCRLIRSEKRPEETYDDVIVRVATEWKCPVATNDRELRNKLRKIGVPVLILRQKHHLELEGAL